MAAAQGLILDPAREGVQPGMLVNIGDTQCTGGFIFDGTGVQAGRHYLGLAAHCVDDHIGAPVSDALDRPFGRVAFSAFPYADYSEDYAFVEIDPAAYERVDPALAGHPDVPTGTLPAGEGAPGDRLQFSGWGFVTASKTETREQRVSALKSHGEELWFAWGIVSNTDSGGPVVHLPTGKALGSVSNYCVPLPVNHAAGFEPGCTAWGPSIAGILADAAKRGFTAEVRTAGEGAPRVSAPAPASTPPVGAPPATAAPAPAPAAPSGPAPAPAPATPARCAAREALLEAQRALRSARRAHSRKPSARSRRRLAAARRQVARRRAAVRRCG
jgi:hypothetical protein